MKEILSNPNVQYYIGLAVLVLASGAISYFAKKDTSMNWLDDLASLAEKAVLYVEQVYRPKYGTKLTEQGKTDIKNKALETLKELLTPKIEKEISRGKKNIDRFLGTILESTLKKIKIKL